jgi:hypothetical protein
VDLGTGSPTFEAEGTCTPSPPLLSSKGRLRRFERCDSAELPPTPKADLSPGEPEHASPQEPMTVCNRMRQRREKMRRYTQQTLVLGQNTSQQQPSGVLTTSSGAMNPVLPKRLLDLATSRLEETGLTSFADINSAFESHYEVRETLGQVRGEDKGRARRRW